MSATRSTGSIDRVHQEAEAVLGPLHPAIEDPVQPEVAPFVTSVVGNPRRLAAVALGPLIALGSHFLELPVVVQDGTFVTLRLPDAIRRAFSILGFGIGEVTLVEQSRPELIWPMESILGVNVVLSGRWRAFALGHHLHVGDRLIFRFRLGALEASVRVFTANGVRCTYPLPVAME
jgi:hypothetical protein